MVLLHNGSKRCRLNGSVDPDQTVLRSSWIRVYTVCTPLPKKRGSYRIYFPNIYSKEVNYEELARCTDDFNGAQLKAVCVEAVSSLTVFPYLSDDDPVEQIRRVFGDN